jgi:hypothetical protein
VELCHRRRQEQPGICEQNSTNIFATASLASLEVLRFTPATNASTRPAAGRGVCLVASWGMRLLPSFLTVRSLREIIEEKYPPLPTVPTDHTFPALPSNSSLLASNKTAAQHLLPPSSSSSPLSSSSAIVIIIQCSKYEIKRSKRGKLYEIFTLYVSDPSYHLFKLIYYGSDALHLLASALPGDILLVHRFNVKIQSADLSLFYGIAESETDTQILRHGSTGEVQFDSRYHPQIAAMVSKLVEWARHHFPFHVMEPLPVPPPPPPPRSYLPASTPLSLSDVPTEVLWIDIVLQLHRLPHVLNSSSSSPHSSLAPPPPPPLLTTRGGQVSGPQRHWLLTDQSGQQVFLKFSSYSDIAIANASLGRHLQSTTVSPSPSIFCQEVLVVRERGRCASTSTIRSDVLSLTELTICLS